MATRSPRGRSPRGAPARDLVSQQAINDARAAHTYNKVSKPKDTKGWKISGATRSIWRKFPNVVYIEQLRLAGMPDEIRTYLRGKGYTDANIEAFLRGAYSQANIQANPALRAAFDAEVAAAGTHRGKAKQPARYDLAVLDRITAGTATNRRSKLKVGGVTAKAKKSPRGRPANLKERLGVAVQKGAVLDVSFLKETGHGAHKREKFGETSGRKHLVDVPGLYSTNAETYRLALQHLGEPPERVEQLTNKFRTMLSSQPSSAPIQPVQPVMPQQPYIVQPQPVPAPMVAGSTAGRVSPRLIVPPVQPQPQIQASRMSPRISPPTVVRPPSQPATQITARVSPRTQAAATTRASPSSIVL